MKLVYCSDPFESRKPDEAYASEASAAQVLGIEYVLIDHDALTMEHDAVKAVKRVKEQPSPVLGLYRGWMMRPEEYRQLYDALQARGVVLLNDPSAYTYCHYLPASYSVIEPYTPKSVWLHVDSDFSIDRVIRLLEPFGSSPIIVKDFVKSQKHYWIEACYIPSASDGETVERVVNRFLELQGDGLNDGLVFRAFVEFEPLVIHSKSGMPLTKEFRVFWFDGDPLYFTQYWDEGDYAGEGPPIEHFRQVGQQVRSRFFTMDVAKCVTGEWMIVELGDGQVAGLPEKADPLEFYKALQSRWPTM